MYYRHIKTDGRVKYKACNFTFGTEDPVQECDCVILGRISSLYFLFCFSVWKLLDVTFPGENL